MDYFKLAQRCMKDNHYKQADTYLMFHLAESVESIAGDLKALTKGIKSGEFVRQLKTPICTHGFASRQDCDICRGQPAWWTG